MKKETSLEITAHISEIIAKHSPCYSYTEEELEKAKETYSEEKLEALRNEGYYFGDFERFYITFRFCDALNLWNRADSDYLKKLFRQTKKMDRSAFLNDPYLKAVPLRNKMRNNVLLSHGEYDRGEFFQAGMPRLEEEIVVPNLGFFTKKTCFPAVYEGNRPWVSVCPSEVSSMAPDLSAARGRTLVLGLGLGYYPFRIASSPKVKSITVIERNPEIIALFREEILPFFPDKKKIRLICADAFDFLAETEPGEFDFCYADIWEGWQDGSEAYCRIRPHEKRLYDCEFRYWIEKEILWYLKNIQSEKSELEFL